MSNRQSLSLDCGVANAFDGFDLSYSITSQRKAGEAREAMRARLE